MPTNLRLRQLEKHKAVKAEDIIQLAYGKYNVPFTRIYKTNEGFKVICRNDQEADKLLTNEAKKDFEHLGTQVIIPPELNAKKTIFIRRVDRRISDNTENEIKEEMERVNTWLKIEEVTKLNNFPNLLKIRLIESTMVQKALQNGILAFNMAIAAHQIEEEEYVNIISCLKCYQLEDHQTWNCPYTNIIICSECSENGHTYKDCQSTNKQCINCKREGLTSNHSTLAMKCPTRKKIMKSKITLKRNIPTANSQSTYAEIAKRAVEEVKQTNNATHIVLSEQKHTMILISIMHAHVMNLCNPGTYQIELNHMLQKNNLPTMWFPNNPDSSKLLGASIGAGTSENQDTNINEMQDSIDTEITDMEQETDTPTQMKQTRETTQKRLDPRLTRRESTNTQSRQECPTQNETQYPETAEEIGLKITMTSKSIYPTRDPHPEHVINQINAGEYKWTYTDKRYTEDIVSRIISQQKIKITKNDFKKVDEGTYRKIRNGLYNRSPGEQRKTKKTC